MDADEREIVHFLQTWGSTFVNGKEIARRASTKKRFGEDPEWAKPVLMRLVEKGVLENDASGRFRMMPEKHDKSKRWVSPDINKILEESGAGVPDAAPIHIEED